MAPRNAKGPKELFTWFQSIKLTAVRCFQTEQELRFCHADGRIARWTLILGENGTGKSLVLQCLAAGAPVQWSQYISSTCAEPGPRAEAVKGFSSGASNSSIEFAVGLAESLGSEILVAADSVASGDGPEFSAHGYGITADHAGISGGMTRATFGATEFGGMLCLAYGPHRRSGAGGLKREEVALDATLFDPNAALPSAEEWFLQRDYASINPRASEAERTAARVARDRVKAALLKLLPGVTDIEARVSDATKGSTELWANVNESWVPVANLGFGYLSTMAWVVDLAVRLVERYPSLENPFAGPAVVLIDEIDLHLHPKWQRTLLTELSQLFPNVQFIATAHSPIIVQSVPDANVIVLRREGQGVVVESSPPNVKHWRIDQILTSDLFGLEGARGTESDVLIARRDKLLAKSKLNKAERDELRTLSKEIASFPGGETTEQREAMELIFRAAKVLGEQSKLKG